jgi:hypothetical protein
MLFEQSKDAAQAANSRANCWVCRFELGNVHDFRQAEKELKKVAGTLREAGLWQVRKPLVLLARIAEQQGRTRDAIGLVQEAISEGKRIRSRHLERDEQYLARLRAKGGEP